MFFKPGEGWRRVDADHGYDEEQCEQREFHLAIE
jgi:hypothetical protein